MPRIVPDRWEVYTAIGRVVGDTNFIPFKVPLKPTLCSRMPEVKRFTPSDLLNSVRRLRLVIDLTNTRRYYNPEDLINSGVRYVKIFCQGHGCIPGPGVVRQFSDAVYQFHHENNDGLIGVHCTHGLNRTGYLICRYMIESLGYSAADAISEFNKARGHDIERIEYINDLYQIEAGHVNTTKKAETVESETKMSGACSRMFRSEIPMDGASTASNSGGGCTQRYPQSNDYYSVQPMFNRLEPRYDVQTGRNVAWNNYGRYNELNGSSFHIPWRQYYSHESCYGSKDPSNHDIDKPAYFSYWC